MSTNTKRTNIQTTTTYHKGNKTRNQLKDNPNPPVNILKHHVQITPKLKLKIYKFHQGT